MEFVDNFESVHSRMMCSWSNYTYIGGIHFNSECSQRHTDLATRRLVRIFSKQWRGGKSSTHDKEDSKTRRPVPGIDGLSCNTCISYTVKTMSVDYGTPDPNSDPSTGEKSSSAVAHQEGSTAEWQTNYRGYYEYDRRHGARRLPNIQPGDQVLNKRDDETQWRGRGVLVKQCTEPRSYLEQTSR